MHLRIAALETAVLIGAAVSLSDVEAEKSSQFTIA
jgi:hypothetical protein